MAKCIRWWWLLILAGSFPAMAADDVPTKDLAPPPGVHEGPPQHRLLNDRFRVTLGAFYADSTTAARLDRGGVGVDIDFEDALGLNKRQGVAEASAYWRVTDRWRFDVDYFNLDRSASRTVARDVTWGGQTYTVGTVVDSDFRVSDLRAIVGYSFFRRPDKELGVGVGLHTTGFFVSLDASGVGATSNSVTAPLPVLSVYGNFALTDTWAMSMRSDWLSLSYNQFSGSVRATAIDFVYQPFTNLAFGFGMHSLLLGLDVQQGGTETQLRLALHGPAAFVSYSY